MGTVCTVADCATKEYAKGLCNKHWQRWRKFGDPLDTVPVGHRRVAKRLSLSEADLAWLAGLLEGEGCFLMASDRKTNPVVYQYPSIRVDMTDLDVIERVAGMWGGRVYSRTYKKRPTHKPLHRAQLTGSRAVEMMQQLLPYMGERRSQKIKELLNSQIGRIAKS